MRRILFLLLLASAARAVNVPATTSLGFSGGGRYYAFQEIWTADGSGFPYRRLHVLDVLKNAYAAQFTLGGEAWLDREARLNERFEREQLRLLRRYGIGGTQLGAVVYQKPVRQPVSYESLRARSSEGIGVALGSGPRLSVGLRATSVPNTCPSPNMLPAGEKPRGLALTVNGRTLQRDARLPAWRKCAYGYRIEEVRVWNDVVAVQLRALLPGFEGPDVLPMVVTGRWK